MYRGVPPESRLVSKSPSTRIAHVRLLSSVDAMVALESIYLGELLPTLVTTIRPLSCVDFNMLVKGIPLGKGPQTHFTFKGFRSSVDSIMMF